MPSTELGNERSNNVGRVKQNSLFYSLGNNHSFCLALHFVAYCSLSRVQSTIFSGQTCYCQDGGRGLLHFLAACYLRSEIVRIEGIDNQLEEEYI